MQQEGGPPDAGDTLHPVAWAPALLRDLFQHVAPNELLLTVQLVCKSWRHSARALMTERGADGAVVHVAAGVPLHALAWKWRTLSPSYQHCVLLTAVGQADMAVLRWAWERGGLPLDRPHLCSRAAQHGHIHVLTWLRARGCAWSAHACCVAAAHGQLAVLMWLRQQECPWDARTCARAAQGGHAEVLQWAHANGAPFDALLCASAARAGRFDLLRWAVEHGAPLDEHACTHAAAAGDLDTLAWVRERGAPWDKAAAASAARAGRLDVLQWMRAQVPPAPWDELACAMAAAGGHLEALQWLRNEGCPWDFFTAAWAAQQGHLEVLQWALDHEASALLVCEYAAVGGQLEVLRWAQQAGCPWEPGACAARAAQAGHAHVAEWIATVSGTG